MKDFCNNTQGFTYMPKTSMRCAMIALDVDTIDVSNEQFGRPIDHSIQLFGGSELPVVSCRELSIDTAVEQFGGCDKMTMM